MKTFENICAQGDMLIIRIDRLPEGLQKVEPENGRHILAHSETGHHHVMLAERVEVYQKPGDLMSLFVVVNQPVPLEHLRAYDTHEPIMFGEGVYHVRRQREYTPEGFRRVED